MGLEITGAPSVTLSGNTEDNRAATMAMNPLGSTEVVRVALTAGDSDGSKPNAPIIEPEGAAEKEAYAMLGEAMVAKTAPVAPVQVAAPPAPAAPAAAPAPAVVAPAPAVVAPAPAVVAPAPVEPAAEKVAPPTGIEAPIEIAVNAAPLQAAELAPVEIPVVDERAPVLQTPTNSVTPSTPAAAEVLAEPEVPEPVTEVVQEEPKEAAKPDLVVKSAGSTKPDLKAKYLAGAHYDNKYMAKLERGSEQKGAITFLQDQLESAGFLKDGAVPANAKGYMNGSVTTSAVHEMQKFAKEMGVDIKVDKPSHVVVFNQSWSVLRAINEFGGKDAVAALSEAGKAEFVARYKEIAKENVQLMAQVGKAPSGALAATSLPTPESLIAIT